MRERRLRYGRACVDVYLDHRGITECSRFGIPDHDFMGSQKDGRLFRGCDGWRFLPEGFFQIHKNLQKEKKIKILKAVPSACDSESFLIGSVEERIGYR